jgi:2-dehydro-3-deoxygluconokinase
MSKVVTLGEIMLRLSTPGHYRFSQATDLHVSYGGSEANVAISLANFGLDAEHVTRFPDNDFGLSATQHLRKYGLATDHIVYGPERMGVYFLENGAMQRASRIVYDRFNSAFSFLKPGMLDWNEILKDAAWFHWSGITPAISQGAADACKEAIKIARKLKVTVSGDINYRRNLWQYGKKVTDVMPELIEGTNYVLGGSTDIDNSTGIKEKSFEDTCIKFMKSFPAVKKVARTKRESVSSSHNRIYGVLFDGKKSYRSRDYELTHIVDRVGAGDAFMAGWIYGSVTDMPDKETIEFAVAASALKHSVEEDINLVTRDEVMALVKEENVGKLMR